MERVKGYCPMGCGETLMLGEGGYVTCSNIDCECPDAVWKLLEDREIEHVVTLHEGDFTIRHPLRERLGDGRVKCDLHQSLMALAGPPRQPGTYRVAYDGIDQDSASLHDDGWYWERISA
jgi:hypothetical protein